MRKILCVFTILCTLMCACMFSACSDKTPDAISDNYENVAEGGSFSSDGGAVGDSAVFDFGKKVLINTVVLKEKGNNVASFRIYADGSDEPIYGNDFIGGYRYCTFAPVETSSLRIEVLDTEGDWKLSRLEAYLIIKQAEDFEVMSYIYADTAYLMTDAQKEIASCVTEFNLFGCTFFDSEGGIRFADYEIDGRTLTGDEVLRGAIAELREANPAAKVVATVLANRDFGDGMTTVERHNSAMGEHASVLTQNLLKLIDDYGLDGVSFDYEYPEKSKDFNVFSDYIKQLDAALPSGKLLTAAISDWCIRTFGYSAKDLEVLDSIEMMAYDMFDERGNHSTFYDSCYSILKSLEKKGVDMSKINLGLPFYSRPINRDSFWGNYYDVAETLSPYENTVVEAYTDLDGVPHPELENYYNGRQMIYDKTRYAIDSGVGGVMIWHFGCDSQDPELSLLNQIAAAIKGEYVIK